MILFCDHVNLCFVCMLQHTRLYVVATEVEYPSPDQFGNLMLSNMQVSLSGEYEVLVRLPGLGTNGEALNAHAPRSVNVDVQSE